MADPLAGKKEDKFTFGLWTVGNRGADPFGPVVRPRFEVPYMIERLAKLGVYGVSLHDNDLIPIDASPEEAERRKKEFEKALKDNGMVVAMEVDLLNHKIDRVVLKTPFGPFNFTDFKTKTSKGSALSGNCFAHSGVVEAGSS